MLFSSWLRSCKGSLERRSALNQIRWLRSPVRRMTSRLGLEALEDRTLLSTYLVTNTGDNGGSDPMPGAGTGTLRQAIVDANYYNTGTAANPDAIQFNIPITDSNYHAPAASVGITNVSLSADVATLTTSDTVPFSAGQTVTVEGLSNSFLDGDYQVIAKTATSFSYLLPHADLASTEDTGTASDPSWFTIAPTSALPQITDSVIINGYTQPRSSPNTLPTEGTYAGDSANRLINLANAGLEISGGNSTVSGLTTLGAVTLDTHSNDVLAGDDLDRVFVNDNIGNNSIGGNTPAAHNMISGRLQFSSLSDNNVIEGNYVGVDPRSQQIDASGYSDGSNNNLVGIAIQGFHNVIGAPGAGNVVAGFLYNILGGGLGTTALVGLNIYQSNYIGTDGHGNKLISPQDGETGIYIAFSHDDLIGGTTSGEGNVIVGCLNGISVFISDKSTIQGNTIVSGAAGIDIAGNDNLIVSNTIAFNNDIVSGVYDFGVVVEPSMNGSGVPVGNSIEGNSIYGNAGLGIDLNEDGVTPNQPGGPSSQPTNPTLTNLSAVASNQDLIITGTITGGVADTTYALNFRFSNPTDPSLPAVFLIDPYAPVTTDGSGNRFFSVTVPESGRILQYYPTISGIFVNPPSRGANYLQNYPVLSSATSSATDTAITGTLNGQANTTFRVEFFANSASDPSGHGQGQTYLGYTSVTTDGTGNATFNNVDLPVGNLASQWLTATATDPNGNTSEFSADAPILAPGETFAQFLQAALPPSSPNPNPMTIVVGPSTMPDTVINAVNALTNVTQPVTIVLDLGGGTHSANGAVANPPPNVTFQVQNGTLDPNYPALTVAGGQVVVSNCTLTTSGNAPTRLVTGGNVTLLNDDIIQASTVYPDPAIAVTGGTVNLGTAATPGNNTLSVNSFGNLVSNTSGNPISAVGDTFVVGGTTETAPSLSFSSLATSTASAIPGQTVTFTATVAPDMPGSATPTGSVDFYDTSTSTDLGRVTLSGGVATLSTSALALGTHVIQASYSGDSTYLPSLASLTQTITQSIYVLNGTASGALSVSGNAGITIPGNLIVDSNARKALTESGNASIRASSIQVVGGVSSSGNATLSPAPVTGAAPVADPLSNLTGPSTSGLTNYGAASYSNGSHTLNPGIYTAIKASGNASLTLNPGIYLIEGGGVTVSGNASLSGTGVLIYNTSSNYPSNTGSYGGITLSGNGTFSLTAPTSGYYAGIVIFQPYANTRAISLSGNAASGLTGTIYAPAALLYLSGNASLNGAAVVNELSLSGNAASTQTAAGSNADNAGSTAGQLLEGDVNVYVNNANGDLTSDELARIQDAVNAVDAVTVPYGVNVAEVTNPTQANVTLNMGTTSAAGNFGQGVLGCYTTAGVITLIQGWNWYAGADPTQISSSQYDFQTTVTHELGHALGLGESNDPTSAMYGTLAPATTIRTLTTADLNIPYAEAGADAQRAALPPANGQSAIVSGGGGSLSGMNPLIAELTGLLTTAWNAYQSEWSSLSALWQSADVWALQRLDALWSLEAGAMGVSKDTLMRDMLFARQSAF